MALLTVDLWLFALWGHWVDRHREPVAPAGAGGAPRRAPAGG